MSRREYPIELIINGRHIEKVVIDSHYEEKHSDSVNDQIIMALVKLLDGLRADPEKCFGSYEYFVNDHLQFEGKFYKLVWLLEYNALYVGVVNCYRR